MRAKVIKELIASEEVEHKCLTSWINYNPIIRDYYCKIHNEGKRTLGKGRSLKMMGLRAGVSDIFLYYPTDKYHGLWLEVKRNKNYTKSERSTPTWIAQELFMENVKSVGYDAHFCFGWIHGKEIVENYLSR